MSVGAFLVDDEAPARRELRFLLSQVEGVEVVGEAGSPSQALAGIRALRPAIAFLDVQMPGLDGLELARCLRELPDPPVLVFATAFERFAVEAFDLEAADYLLKPFTAERVARAVQKARRAREARAALPAADAEGTADVKRVLVQQRGRLIPVEPAAIVFVRSAGGGESEVHTADEAFASRSSLAALEALLAPYGFARVHRTALVNLGRIAELVPWFNGAYRLVMDDAARSEILVSRYHARELRHRFVLGK